MSRLPRSDQAKRFSRGAVVMLAGVLQFAFPAHSSAQKDKRQHNPKTSRANTANSKSVRRPGKWSHDNVLLELVRKRENARATLLRTDSKLRLAEKNAQEFTAFKTTYFALGVMSLDVLGLHLIETTLWGGLTTGFLVRQMVSETLKDLKVTHLVREAQDSAQELKRVDQELKQLQSVER